MKKYTFVFYEYDSQASQCSKYYFIKVPGNNWRHAYNKAQEYVEKRNSKDLDYHSKLLTLNQYNELRKKQKPNAFTEVLRSLPWISLFFQK